MDMAQIARCCRDGRLDRVVASTYIQKTELAGVKLPTDARIVTFTASADQQLAANEDWVKRTLAGMMWLSIRRKYVSTFQRS